MNINDFEHFPCFCGPCIYICTHRLSSLCPFFFPLVGPLFFFHTLLHDRVEMLILDMPFLPPVSRPTVCVCLDVRFGFVTGSWLLFRFCVLYMSVGSRGRDFVAVGRRKPLGSGHLHVTSRPLSCVTSSRSREHPQSCP